MEKYSGLNYEEQEEIYYLLKADLDGSLLLSRPSSLMSSGTQKDRQTHTERGDSIRTLHFDATSLSSTAPSSPANTLAATPSMSGTPVRSLPPLSILRKFPTSPYTPTVSPSLPPPPPLPQYTQLEFKEKKESESNQENNTSKRISHLEAIIARNQSEISYFIRKEIAEKLKGFEDLLVENAVFQTFYRLEKIGSLDPGFCKANFPTHDIPLSPNFTRAEDDYEIIRPSDMIIRFGNDPLRISIFELEKLFGERFNKWFGEITNPGSVSDEEEVEEN